MTEHVLRSLTEWLDALVAADPDDRTMLGIRVSDAGLALKKVRCVRCKVDLNVTAAVAHLRRTESSYRFRHGPDARLHQVGDLVSTEPPTAWAMGECRFCGRPVIWAQTAAGRRMPVDAEPNPAGNVALVSLSGAATDRPLAMVLHTEFARASTPDEVIHTSHMKTCLARPIRPPGTT